MRRKFAHALNDLRRLELVRAVDSDSEEYIFKHALVQDTVYASLLKTDRKELHRAVAVALEQEGQGQLDELAARLAQHYDEAGDARKTLDYAARAGDAAARVYANAEAVTQYTLALTAADRLAAEDTTFEWNAHIVPLYEKRGRVLEVIAKFADALAAYRELGERARACGNRPAELASLVLSASAVSAPTMIFNAEQAQQLCDQALALARELDDRAAQARVLWILTLLNIHLSRPERSLIYGEESLAITRALEQEGKDVRRQLAYTLHELFLPYRVTGQIERARETLRQERALWRELDNKPLLADSLGMEAQFALLSGTLSEGKRAASEGLATSQAIGNVFGQTFNRAMLMLLTLEEGDLEQVFAIGDQEFQLGQSVNFGASTMSAHLAWLAGSLGAFPRAALLEQRTRAAIPLPMPEHFRARAFGELARLNVLRGDLAAATADLDAAVRISDPNNLYSQASDQILFAHAELALAREDYAQALERLEQGLAICRRLEFEGLMPELLFLRARALTAVGRDPEALDGLEQAHLLAAKIGMRRMLWQILAARGAAAAERGNLAAAELYRRQARQVVDYIAAHSPADVRASMLQLPAVRALNPAGSG